MGQEDRLKANLVVFGRFFRNEISQKEVPALFGPGKLKIFDPFLDFRYLKISLLEEVNGLKGDEHCGIFGSFKFRPFAVRFQSLAGFDKLLPQGALRVQLPLTGTDGINLSEELLEALNKLC